METKKLELKDICGYLPYDLRGIWVSPKLNGDKNYIGHIVHIGLLSVDYYIKNNADVKPILRPLSDLYKTITHKGKEIIPIVELANLSFCFDGRNNCWVLNGHYAEYDTGYDYIKFCYSDSRNCFDSTRGTIRNQYQLFDYLNELKIDYRGLIDAGLAIDANTLNENPYK